MAEKILLKSDGHAREYWNGSRYVEFEQNHYEATEAEAKVLLKCAGVYKAPEHQQARITDFTPVVEDDQGTTEDDNTPTSAPEEVRNILDLGARDAIAKIQEITTTEQKEFLLKLAEYENAGKARSTVLNAILQQIPKLESPAPLPTQPIESLVPTTEQTQPTSTAGITPQVDPTQAATATPEPSAAPVDPVTPGF